MEECWRTGTVPSSPSPRSAAGRNDSSNELLITDPAERPSMEEAFERLSDMYSIEVQAMPPALAYYAFPCYIELRASPLQLQREHFHGGQSDQV